MYADTHLDQNAGALAGLDEIQIQCRKFSFGIQDFKRTERDP